MANNYLCIDYSGSTGGSKSYWQYVKNLVEKKGDHKIILWDDMAVPVNKENAMKIVNSMTGNGGTQPQCLIPHLPEKSSVVIVTDGQISGTDVSTCDSLLSEREFSNVEMHFVKTGGSMDLSVVAPFTRKTSYTIYKDGDILSTGSTAKLFDLTEYYDNPQKFIDDSEKLLQQVTISTMGKPNIPLRNSILNLQENLLRFISKIKSENSDFTSLRNLLTNQKYEESLACLKRIIDASTGNDIAKQVDRIIQALINQCANPKTFDFTLLKPSRLLRAEVVQSVVAEEELPKIKNYEGTYECPIMFDVDSPCCLIRKGPPVLDGLDNSYLNNLMANPLLLLEDNNLKLKLKNRFDHVFGLEAVNVLFGNGEVVSPITRSEISCVLTFGLDATHKKSTKYTLANLFFGQKLAGALDLWLSVVYFAMWEIPYLASNNDFMTQFSLHLIDRLKKHSTRITLTGLSIEPMLTCPFDLAIWYCIVSPLLVNPNSICNRLREFGPTAVYLTKLLDLLGYPYDKDFTSNRIRLYTVFNWMMRQENNNNHEWRKAIRSIYQNSMLLSDGTIVMLDGAATTARLPAVCQNLTHRELIALSKLVDRTKKREFINIPMELDCDIPAPVFNYKYNDDIPDHKVHISPKTLRPYCYDKTNKLPWEDSCVKVYGQVNDVLSGNAYFIKYIQEKLQYPTKESLIKYMATKQENKLVPKDTLPTDVEAFVDNIFERYEEVLGKDFADISPGEFACTTEISRNRAERPFMEEAENLAQFAYH